MPKSGLKLHEWLLHHAKEKTFGDSLTLIPSHENCVRLRWVHQRNHRFNSADIELFRQWSYHTNSSKNTDDDRYLKEKFRNAINRAKEKGRLDERLDLVLGYSDTSASGETFKAYEIIENIRDLARKDRVDSAASQMSLPSPLSAISEDHICNDILVASQPHPPAVPQVDQTDYLDELLVMPMTNNVALTQDLQTNAAVVAATANYNTDVIAPFHIQDDSLEKFLEHLQEVPSPSSSSQCRQQDASHPNLPTVQLQGYSSLSQPEALLVTLMVQDVAAEMTAPPQSWVEPPSSALAAKKRKACEGIETMCLIPEQPFDLEICVFYGGVEVERRRMKSPVDVIGKLSGSKNSSYLLLPDYHAVYPIIAAREPADPKLEGHIAKLKDNMADRLKIETTQEGDIRVTRECLSQVFYTNFFAPNESKKLERCTDDGGSWKRVFSIRDFHQVLSSTTTTTSNTTSSMPSPEVILGIGKRLEMFAIPQKRLPPITLKVTSSKASHLLAMCKVKKGACGESIEGSIDTVLISDIQSLAIR